MNTTEKQMSSYIATVVHDLKTPITAQISALQLLLNNTLGTLNEEQRELLEQIKQSCEYSKNLVHAILETYLMENNQISPKPEKFDFGKLLDNVVKETSNLAKDKSQIIINKTIYNNSDIFADKLQLKRVLVNLISNAIKYGFSNSIIEVETRQENKNIVFNVKNCSSNINQTNADNLFDKFVRNGNEKNGLNCGLGLYLVKQIINAHHGKVFSECKKDGTCIFGFFLPKDN